MCILKEFFVISFIIIENKKIIYFFKSSDFPLYFGNLQIAKFQIASLSGSMKSFPDTFKFSLLYIVYYTYQSPQRAQAKFEHWPYTLYAI